MKDVIEIRPETTEQWLTLRGGSIGGSELSTMLGLNKWQSPYDLWEIKTGRSQAFVGNNATLRGRFIESGIAKWWEYETGNTLIKASEGNIVYKHKRHKISGSPDYRYFPKGSVKLSDRRVLEVKTTKTTILPEDLPMSFFLQPNSYAAMLEYDKFSIVWFSMFSDELQYIEYDTDMELYKMCCEEADNFYDNYIIPDVPPNARTESDVLKLFPKHSEGKIIVADDNLLETYSRAIDHKRSIKELDKLYEQTTDQVKLIMKDAEKVVDMNMNVLFTWKANKNGSRVFNIKEV